jgi:flavin-dependent dehydrogenase
MAARTFSNELDVIVIGGGPSGAACATLLAQQGLAVQVFERDHFPRFHVGESLIPQTYHVIQRLKLLDKMKASPFVRKHSVQFITEKGKLSEPFYFYDHKPHESSQTWQVLRSDFDLMLLNNAREQGAQVHEGVRVLEVLFEGTRAVGVRIKLEEDGSEHIVRAKVIVDASGQSCLISSRMGFREWDPVLKKAAIWTYWKGAKREAGRDEGGTIIMQTQGKKGWFWYIPLHDDVISVGVVAAYDYLFEGRESKDFEKIYFEEVARCPGLQPRLVNATMCEPMRAQKEYSYRTRQAGGDGWVMIGDAYGFLDPLYSSGVLLALVSAEMAADAIAAGFQKGDTSAAQLNSWNAVYAAGMDRMRRLVCEFYDGFSFGRFVKKHPHLKGHITDILIGDIFKDDIDILWPLMDEMRAEMTEMAMADA